MIKNHWWTQARRCFSPNCDERPDPEDISLIVIHNISLPPGEFGQGDVLRFFTNQLPVEKHPFYREIAAMRVSAHVFIQRDGQAVQFVPFHWRAWHAGKSEFQGRTQCNDFSIGIEMEGTDDTPFEDIQYDVLNQLIDDLEKTYPLIQRERIVGHSDIAPRRKTDPGPYFEWERIRKGRIL